MAAKRTHKEYTMLLRAKHGVGIEAIEKYAGYNCKIQHKCNTCNHIWLVQPRSILNHGCPKCEDLSQIGSTKFKPIMSNKEYKAKLFAKHGDSISALEKYKGTAIDIRHKCNVCGDIWNAKPGNVLRAECPSCSRASKKIYKEEFKEHLDAIHKGKIKILKYTTYQDHSLFECNVCRNRWWTRPRTIKQSLTGCPACAGSVRIRGNKEKLVTLHGVEYVLYGFEHIALEWILAHTKIKAEDIYEYRSGEVPFIKYAYKDKTTYHFPDFYIPKKNTLVEVKSLSTIGIRPFKRGTRKSLFYAACRKAKASIEQGYKYVLLVMHKGKPVKLPKRWYDMKFAEFISYLPDF